MRHPDQLPSVLHDLSRHPGAKHLLNNPPSLATYLRSQGWPENLEEAAEQLALPDSEQAQELAEMTPLVETWLKTLSYQQQVNLGFAVEELCQGSMEALETMFPANQPA